MMIGEGMSDAERRKKKERIIIEEGTELWRRKKLQEAKEKKEEQRRLQAMLASYHPWGRPGHGAPNDDVRRRQLGLAAVESRKGLEQPQPKWGGVPRPVPCRRSDPILRYQLHEPVRKSIENHDRYRRPYHEQLQYKEQLDRLVAEKRRLQDEERREQIDLWNMTGWTTEPALQRMEYQHLLQDQQRAESPKYPMLTDARREIHPPEESLTGGVELVPLLARRRTGYRRKTLSSTDVTRVNNGRSVPKPVWKQPVSEREYLRELTNQIISKEMKMKEARSEDIVKSKRHFETWGGFWGRPGHGAPKGNNYKEKLEYLLYQIPVATT